MEKDNKFKKEKKNENEIDIELSSVSIGNQPETAFEMVNKYGTYEIQPTADTDNTYPAIAGGFAGKNKKKNPSKKTEK